MDTDSECDRRSETAITVVKTDSRRVCSTALRSVGLWKIELMGSPQYHRIEKPCHALCDLPLLKENSTATAMGASDQMR